MLEEFRIIIRKARKNNESNHELIDRILNDSSMLRKLSRVSDYNINVIKNIISKESFINSL